MDQKRDTLGIDFGDFGALALTSDQNRIASKKNEVKEVSGEP